jgi:hypothetical protein
LYQGYHIAFYSFFGFNQYPRSARTDKRLQKMANSASPQEYTNEKAVQLIRVYGVIMKIFGLIGWMHLTVVRPLHVEEKEMV